MISGTSRSGSTLLTIILGEHKECVAVGELVNYVSNGILSNEYCSCGALANECSVWKDVKEKWDRKRILTYEDYDKIQKSVTRNKGTLSLLKNMVFPSSDFKNYIQDTKFLYDTIFEVTHKNVIVDSSKPAQRILVLKKCGIPFTVLHISRKFSLVLNSNKKQHKKDLKRGLEKTILPKRTSYVLMNRCISNLLVWVFCKGVPKIRIKYQNIIESLVSEISKIVDVDTAYLGALTSRGPFPTKHIIAGNRIRMKEQIFVASECEGENLDNLSRKDKILAKFVNIFYGN